jgi:hypothetical protein
VINTWQRFVRNGCHFERSKYTYNIKAEKYSVKVRTGHKWLRTGYRKSNEAAGHQSRDFLNIWVFIRVWSNAPHYGIVSSQSMDFICLGTRDRFAHRNLINVIGNMRSDYMEMDRNLGSNRQHRGQQYSVAKHDIQITKDERWHTLFPLRTKLLPFIELL